MADQGRVIGAADVPALLLAALPRLRAQWSDIEQEHADEGSPGGRLGYLDAGWVVAHLADRLAAGDTADFGAAFALIEDLIRRGDRYVVDLTVVGYLEGLQSSAVTQLGLDPEAFRPWLGPKSVAAWESLIRFWGASVPEGETE